MLDRDSTRHPTRSTTTAPASPVLGFISLNMGVGSGIPSYGPGGVCGGQGSHAIRIVSHHASADSTRNVPSVFHNAVTRTDLTSVFSRLRSSRPVVWSCWCLVSPICAALLISVVLCTTCSCCSHAELNLTEPLRSPMHA